MGSLLRNWLFCFMIIVRNVRVTCIDCLQSSTLPSFFFSRRMRERNRLRTRRRRKMGGARGRGAGNEIKYSLQTVFE